MYEVLCGKPAPKGDKLHHIIESVLNDSPEKPSDVTSQRVPPLLEEMVMRALEKNPDNRYQSIREMIQIMKQDWRSGMFS